MQKFAPRVETEPPSAKSDPKFEWKKEEEISLYWTEALRNHAGDVETCRIARHV